MHRLEFGVKTLVLLVSFGAVACGGDGGLTPTAPTAVVPPSPTIRSIGLSLATPEIVVGNSSTVVATATYSDGSTRGVAPTWMSSSPSVVAVDLGGVVRAMSGGTATITATVSGVSSSVTARAIPNYSGQWYGQYRFVSCAAPPRWGSSYCGPYLGKVYNMELNLGMNGSQVTGSIRMGGNVGSVSGSVTGDGSLSLRGRYSSSTGFYTEEIRTWLTKIVNGTSMTGRWDTIGMVSGESQTGFNEYEMISLSR